MMKRFLYNTAIFMAVLSLILLVCLPFQDSPVKLVPLVLAFVLYTFIVNLVKSDQGNKKSLK